jgi:hypothetical protein
MHDSAGAVDNRYFSNDVIGEIELIILSQRRPAKKIPNKAPGVKLFELAMTLGQGN